MAESDGWFVLSSYLMCFTCVYLKNVTVVLFLTLIPTGQACLTMQPGFQFTVQSVGWCVLVLAMKLVGSVYFPDQQC